MFGRVRGTAGSNLAACFAARQKRALAKRVPSGSYASSDRDHDIRCLDHRVCFLTFGELEIVNGLVGDRHGNDLTPANVEANVSRGLTLGNVNNSARDSIARAELHKSLHCEAMPPKTRIGNPREINALMQVRFAEMRKMRFSE